MVVAEVAVVDASTVVVLVAAYSAVACYRGLVLHSVLLGTVTLA